MCRWPWWPWGWQGRHYHPVPRKGIRAATRQWEDARAGISFPESSNLHPTKPSSGSKSKSLNAEPEAHGVGEGQSQNRGIRDLQWLKAEEPPLGVPGWRDAGGALSPGPWWALGSWEELGSGAPVPAGPPCPAEASCCLSSGGLRNQRWGWGWGGWDR